MLNQELVPHWPQDDVYERQDGPSEEESEIAPDLPNEARPVADDVLQLVGEVEVLEPDLHHPLRVSVDPREVVPELIRVLVRVVGTANGDIKLLFLWYNIHRDSHDLCCGAWQWTAGVECEFQRRLVDLVILLLYKVSGVEHLLHGGYVAADGDRAVVVAVPGRLAATPKE